MNLDPSSLPPHDPEVRITSLLLGELSPADAASLEQEIAGNPGLAQLRDRLRQTLALVQASVAQPAGTTGPVAPETRISPEKRAQLLARLTPRPSSRIGRGLFTLALTRLQGVAWAGPMAAAAGILFLLALAAAWDISARIYGSPNFPPFSNVLGALWTNHAVIAAETMHTLRRAALGWLTESGERYDVRFDVASIVLGPPMKLDYFENAF